MSNPFSGTDLVAQPPLPRIVTVGEGVRRVAELRVFCEQRRAHGRGGLGQNGGFWLKVTVADERRVRQAATPIWRGASVHVAGRLMPRSGTTPKPHIERTSRYMKACAVYPCPVRLAAVSLPQRRVLRACAA